MVSVIFFIVLLDQTGLSFLDNISIKIELKLDVLLLCTAVIYYILFSDEKPQLLGVPEGRGEGAIVWLPSVEFCSDHSLQLLGSNKFLCD